MQNLVFAGFVTLGLFASYKIGFWRGGRLARALASVSMAKMLTHEEQDLCNSDLKMLEDVRALVAAIKGET